MHGHGRLDGEWMLCEQSVITDNILQALSPDERLALLLPHGLPARAIIRVAVTPLQPSVDAGMFDTYLIV